MTKSVHHIYIGSMVAIVIAITCYLSLKGFSYYATPLEDRFYHESHNLFKPSGFFGHGLGIIGTLMILFGVTIYIARKRYNFLARLIRLKYLLEFHIFLCTLGPIMVLFHTAFKFGGVVSIAFWSMIAVVLSGVIGRFIYIQIPRTIEGRELSLNEVKLMKARITESLVQNRLLPDEATQLVLKVSDSEPAGKQDMSRRSKLKTIKSILVNQNIKRKDRRGILKMIREEMALTGKIARLQQMQKIFKYWHVAHLPFALIMLIIVVVHVGITLAFGYKWIF